MNNWKELIVNNYQGISRAGVLLISIIFVALIMPQSSFNYNYNLGQPWQYKNLLAPFNFPVLKTTESFDNDVNLVKKNFIPYYDIINIAPTRIGSFRTALDMRMKDIPDSLLSFSRDIYYAEGEKIIEAIYKKGLLQLNQAHTDKEVIYVTENGGETASLKNIDLFFNTKTANAFIDEVIFDKDPVKFQLVKTTIAQILLPNIVEKTAFNTETLNNSIKNVSKYEKGVQKGENIISMGEPISQNSYQKLISLSEEYKKRTNETTYISYRLLGYIVISAICFLVLFYYLRFFEPWIYSSLRKYAFLFLIIVLFLSIIRIFVNGEFESTNYYLIPFCILPILLRSFFKVGVFSYVFLITLVLAYFILPVGYDFILLNLVVGFIAFASSNKTYYWSQFFTVAAIVLCAYFTGYTALELIRNNSFIDINYDVYKLLIANALLTLLAYPLIPLFEKFFGFLSNISLVELGDLNKPLLRELQAKAPGTMHHSLEVANLAENAAREINADPMLVKVAALYHDIGKMNNPIYFIENQENVINPHDELLPEESAKIIIDHVIEGIEIAKAYKLPNILIDFIRTHHGETYVEYFYQKYKQLNPDTLIEDDDFRYPGPLPYSKETALLMLADSVEASTKTLKSPTGVEIDAFIDKIIDLKIAKNQLENCDLSFKDIRAIRKSFKKSLRSKYHVRIEYPAKILQDKNEKNVL